MKVHQKRDALRKAYAGEKWKKKVDAMSDDQVAAVYLRLKGQGKV